jgi:hypothetical protein
VTEHAERPAVDVVVTRAIRRPIEVVAQYASDPSNAPEWYNKISEVEWKTPSPLQVGTEVAFVARFLGRALRYTYMIVEHTPVLLVMRSSEGPFPMETSYRFEPTSDGGTRMTLRNRGTPGGFSRAIAPFVRAAMRLAMSKDLATLKERLERD